MRTVIVGCGRVGSSLARQLSEEGDDVTVVDSSEAAFNRLGEDFAGEMVFGSAVDEDILRRAGTDRAEAFVAALQFDTPHAMAPAPVGHTVRVKEGNYPDSDPGLRHLFPPMRDHATLPP